MTVVASWRPEPESNRRARICSPLRNHSAIGPRGVGALSSNAAWRLQRTRLNAATIASGVCYGYISPRQVERERVNKPSFDDMRQAMIDCQLRTTGVSDPRVVAAFAAVPRERFVPADRAMLAY